LVLKYQPTELSLPQNVPVAAVPDEGSDRLICGYVGVNT
jgi:hypothetical protein